MKLTNNYLPSVSAMVMSIMLASTSNGAIAVDYNISGFLSAGAGKINRDDIAYQDYRDDVSYRTDSSAGVQLDLNITNKLSTTIQVVARGYLPGDEDDEWEPGFEWAYVSYRITPKLSIHTGRLRLPYYFYSQTLDVGYSYQWVRPPTDNYPPSLIPTSSFDGFSMDYTEQVWALDLQAQLFAGTYEVSSELSGFNIGIDAKEVAGLNFVWSYEDFVMRYGFVYSKVDLEPEGIEALTGAYKSFVDANNSKTNIFGKIAEDIDSSDARSYYHSMALIYDIGTWVFHSEFYYVGTNDHAMRRFKGGFLSVGYQFGNFTPYVSFGRVDDYSDGVLFGRIEDSKADDIVPVGSNPTIDLFRDITVSTLDIDTKQSTFTIGVRADVMENTALKFEIQRFHLKHDTVGQLSLDEGGAVPDNVTLYSIAVDYVFQ